MFDKRILIVIPHPDDEVVGCAAAIARAQAQGARVYGIYLGHGCLRREALWPWQGSGYQRRVARRILSRVVTVFVPRSSSSLSESVQCGRSSHSASVTTQKTHTRRPRLRCLKHRIGFRARRILAPLGAIDAPQLSPGVGARSALCLRNLFCSLAAHSVPARKAGRDSKRTNGYE